jgi:excinuclease ABC subunit A
MPKKPVSSKNVINNESLKGSDDFGDELTHIIVKGAREHNLKNISTEIPRDILTVITGISGSGKSSLAFDTLYAEGQRRYVECLSPYARQFLGMMKKPDIDSIEGLSPAISIEQKSVGNNPRSTVGTVTEIYDYLRLLFAKIGIQHCISCSIPVQKQTIDQIVDTILSMPEHSKIMILAPVIKGRKGHYKELFEQFRKQGYTKVRIDGELCELVEGMQISRFKTHTIEVVIDRLLVQKDNRQRINESIEIALKMGESVAMVLSEISGLWQEKLFSTLNTCPQCGNGYEAPAPNSFSFNSPFGACSQCEGLGYISDFDIQLMIPNKKLSLADGAIGPLGKKRKVLLWNQIIQLSKQLRFSINDPYESLPDTIKDILLLGSKDKVLVQIPGTSSTFTAQIRFEGILTFFKQVYNQTASSDIRQKLETVMGAVPCPKCMGGRLKESSLAVKIDDKSITEMSNLDILQAAQYFSDLGKKLSKRDITIANIILKEIISRLEFLSNVGLEYLSLNRSSRTLSGGESQRIRLASQIGSQLVGVTYVLDEPSIGLHQHDNGKLIQSLKNLRDIGNTVLVVEHDRDMIEQADYLLDIGPGAGVHGGNIVFAGNPKDLLSEDGSYNPQFPLSSTARYLSGQDDINVPLKRKPSNGNTISLYNASGNNLKNVDVNIPLGVFTCITGMSGSGKSTLINDTLFPILTRHFYRATASPLPYGDISGLEHIDKVIEIDQAPIGRTPRSNPVTYTGVFTLIRDFFTQLPESKIRGYKQGRFSFNVPGGRCEECEGAGLKKIEMNYLPDVFVICDICNGKRYNNETLQVTYKGKTIADVLSMTIEESLEFFSELSSIKRKLQALFDVGLGYITLGQQAPTLSGGEAQRVKLATELSKISTGKTLYLLDEPTTGLHFQDITYLLSIIYKLVEKGNTVVVIEHNLDIIKCADWIIDMGPTGGANGGFIIAQGTPEQISNDKNSITATYLKKELERSASINKKRDITHNDIPEKKKRSSIKKP